MPSKHKKTVHLDDSLHRKLKNKAFQENSYIEQVVHDILRKELRSENDDKNEKEK